MIINEDLAQKMGIDYDQNHDWAKDLTYHVVTWDKYCLHGVGSSLQEALTNASIYDFIKLNSAVIALYHAVSEEKVEELFICAECHPNVSFGNRILSFGIQMYHQGYSQAHVQKFLSLF